MVSKSEYFQGNANRAVLEKPIRRAVDLPPELSEYYRRTQAEELAKSRFPKNRASLGKKQINTESSVANAIEAGGGDMPRSQFKQLAAAGKLSTKKQNVFDDRINRGLATINALAENDPAARNLQPGQTLASVRTHTAKLSFNGFDLPLSLEVRTILAKDKNGKVGARSSLDLSSQSMQNLLALANGDRRAAASIATLVGASLFGAMLPNQAKAQTTTYHSITGSLNPNEPEPLLAEDFEGNFGTTANVIGNLFDPHGGIVNGLPGIIINGYQIEGNKLAVQAVVSLRRNTGGDPIDASNNQFYLSFTLQDDYFNNQPVGQILYLGDPLDSLGNPITFINDSGDIIPSLTPLTTANGFTALNTNQSWIFNFDVDITSNESFKSYIGNTGENYVVEFWSRGDTFFRLGIQDNTSGLATMNPKTFTSDLSARTLTSGDDSYGLNIGVKNTAGATPEPSTAALLIVGFLALRKKFASFFK